MFIETEATPNPEVLKFMPGRPVMGSDAALEFKTQAEAVEASPLAAGLFAVDGVNGVFFGGDYISVTKHADYEWYVLKPAILGAIMQHFVTNQPVLYENAPAADISSGTNFDPEDEEIVNKIEQLLASRVRPAVAQDGGDIVFHGFERGVVYLTMRGACAGCPSSSATLKMGIENMLRHYIPEVVEVRQA